MKKKFICLLAVLSLLLQNCQKSPNQRDYGDENLSTYNNNDSKFSILEDGKEHYLFDDPEWKLIWDIENNLWGRIVQNTEKLNQLKSIELDELLKLIGYKKEEFDKDRERILIAKGHLAKKYDLKIDEQKSCVSCEISKSDSKVDLGIIIELVSNKPKSLDMMIKNYKDLDKERLLYEKLMASKLNFTDDITQSSNIRRELKLLRSAIQKVQNFELVTGLTSAELRAFVMGPEIQKEKYKSAIIKSKLDETSIKREVQLSLGIIKFLMADERLQDLKFNDLVGIIVLEMNGYSSNYSIQSSSVPPGFTCGSELHNIENCIDQSSICIEGFCAPTEDSPTVCDGVVYACYLTCFGGGGVLCAYLCYCGFCNGPTRDAICLSIPGS
ncbi:hypothetical protein FAZ15_03515 [Sphingobacterium olei]|uniref:Uncharacterized protein n=1 Tax=Sphingobacterium olei TaxID=2571155 RepID=A0A4U0P7N2_9SPHI|nr:hypothetical protein [Sphingobacterium olei]TJZ63360.1 hypothetical protein FAZ15_03515 [Sphingobacterium olei]